MSGVRNGQERSSVVGRNPSQGYAEIAARIASWPPSVHSFRGSRGLRKFPPSEVARLNQAMTAFGQFQAILILHPDFASFARQNGTDPHDLACQQYRVVSCLTIQRSRRNLNGTIVEYNLVG